MAISMPSSWHPASISFKKMPFGRNWDAATGSAGVLAGWTEGVAV